MKTKYAVPFNISIEMGKIKTSALVIEDYDERASFEDDALKNLWRHAGQLTEKRKVNAKRIKDM